MRPDPEEEECEWPVWHIVVRPKNKKDEAKLWKEWLENWTPPAEWMQ